MKCLSRFSMACLVVWGILATDADAALISIDTSFGLDTATLDTDTGLRWLDVTLSTAYSYDGILPELDPGGVFDGYRIATRSEVATFFTNAGIPAISTSFEAANYGPVLALMALVGVTGNDGNLGTGIPFDYTVGHAFDAVPPQAGWVWVPNLGAYAPDLTARASIFSSVPSDNNNPKHGTWLVAVPEPNTLVLIGFALAALSLRRRLSS